MITRANGIVITACSAALTASADVAAAFAGREKRILEIVPEKGVGRLPQYPYVTFAGVEKRGLPPSCNEPRAIVTPFVHVWDSDKTITRVSDITEACEAALLALVLAPETGLRIVDRNHVLTRCAYDQDAALLLGLCQISYTVTAVA